MNALKRTIFELLLANGVVGVFVYRTPGLIVAANFPDDFNLEYGLDMPNPIPDIETTDAGISATLSFGQQTCKTFVPWDSVIGLALPNGRFSAIWNQGNPTREKPGLTLVS